MTPRHHLRRRVLLALWLFAGLAVVVRSAQVQLGEGDEWRALAAAQHRTQAALPAARGSILDRDGAALAVSREVYGVAVAPREIEDVDEVRRALQESLGLSAREAERLTDPADPWHVVPGRYEPSVRAALGPIRGVHLERQLQRFHPHGELARGILGTVLDGSGQGGIEQAYDELLRGRPGRQVMARDHVGRPIPGETFVVEQPVAGGEVRLTIDLDLQEIAQEALAQAVAETGARGGDLIVSEPRTGEILALVSVRDGRTDALSAINAPYEPGSTLKPFTVAALLRHGVATLADSVDEESRTGYWIAPGGKPLRDVHAMGPGTLADALRESSNVGIAKAALELSPRQQYETLRDFGFGVPTGIPLPGEVGGMLGRPEGWTARSGTALAIGYEIAVTPIQMAMAYGALANGGRLMEPRLIREVRDGRGALLERHDAEEVRAVVPARVTRELGEVLVDVVEGGTGTAARLSTFRVAGKSGTSRAYVAGVGYRAGAYFASFAGFFPADDPQLVVFVKLDSPQGKYYGGATAAPVTRATMEAVLAARQAPIDRQALLRAVRTPPVEADVATPPRPHVRFASLTIDGARPPVPAARTPEAGSAANSPDGAPGPAVVAAPGQVVVPDVTGLPSRVALRRLHALGLRVEWDGTGAVERVRPAPGTAALPGDTVRLTGGQGRR